MLVLTSYLAETGKWSAERIELFVSKTLSDLQVPISTYKALKNMKKNSPKILESLICFYKAARAFQHSLFEASPDALSAAFATFFDIPVYPNQDKSRG